MSLRAGVLLAAVAALFSAGPLAANAQARDCWFTTHETLADWALRQNVDEHTFQSRYF